MILCRKCGRRIANTIQATKSFVRSSQPRSFRAVYSIGLGTVLNRSNSTGKVRISSSSLADRTIVHVEHIIPQKIKTKKAKNQLGDWPGYLGPNSLANHPRYVARIGNLTLFAGELNIGASNNPYHRKKDSYTKSAFQLTKTLPVEYPEFRFEEVEARSRHIADAAVRIWPSI